MTKSYAERKIEYQKACRKNDIIMSTCANHGGSINDLCMTGHAAFKVVEFTAFDGVRRKANCLLTAEDFLHSIGQYRPDQMIPVVYHR